MSAHSPHHHYAVCTHQELGEPRRPACARGRFFPEIESAGVRVSERDTGSKVRQRAYIGHIDDAVVSLGAAYMGQSDTRIARGSLHNRPAWLDLACDEVIAGVKA